MAVPRFNPITYSHKLQEAGFNQRQAEIQAEELANFVNNDLVTKSYLSQEIQILKKDIIIWLGSTIIVTGGIIIGSVAYFLHNYLIIINK